VKSVRDVNVTEQRICVRYSLLWLTRICIGQMDNVLFDIYIYIYIYVSVHITATDLIMVDAYVSVLTGNFGQKSHRQQTTQHLCVDDAQTQSEPETAGDEE